MSNKIKGISLAFNCPYTWNSLSDNESGKSCDSCKHKVFDFTDKDEKYLKELLKTNDFVCGRFRNNQLSKSFIKYVAPALFLTASIGFSAHSQELNVKELCNPPEDELEQMTVGIVIEEIPVPEVGFGEFIKIISQKIHFPQSFPEGKVYVKFIVDINGVITNPEIIKGLTPKADEEVLKVFENLDIKFKPGKQAGKPVATPYIMPIIFTHKKI